MKLYIYISLFFTCTIFLLLTCQKPDDFPFPYPYHEECLEFPNLDGTGYWYVDLDTGYSAPFFNPQNSSEFLFKKSYEYYPQPNWRSSKEELWKYNMTTKVQKKITDKVWLAPHWGPDDWIIFNHQDAHLWKIKSDGTELTQLTQEGKNYHPSWSPDGKWIVFDDADNGTGPTLRIINTQGEFREDIFPAAFRKSYPAWSPDGTKVAASSTSKLFYWDLETHTSKSLTDSAYLFIGPKVWFPDNKRILWDSQDGLAITDIETRSTTYLRQDCDAYLYVFCSINKEGTKIITTRVDSHIENRDSIVSKSKIVMMNPDGTDEEVILE